MLRFYILTLVQRLFFYFFSMLQAVSFLMHPKSPIGRLLVDHPTGSGKTREMIKAVGVAPGRWLPGLALNRCSWMCSFRFAMNINESLSKSKDNEVHRLLD